MKKEMEAANPLDRLTAKRLYSSSTGFPSEVIRGRSDISCARRLLSTLKELDPSYEMPTTLRAGKSIELRWSNGIVIDVCEDSYFERSQQLEFPLYRPTEYSCLARALFVHDRKK